MAGGHWPRMISRMTPPPTAVESPSTHTPKRSIFFLISHKSTRRRKGYSANTFYITTIVSIYNPFLIQQSICIKRYQHRFIFCFLSIAFHPKNPYRSLMKNIMKFTAIVRYEASVRAANSQSTTSIRSLLIYAIA